MHEIVVLISGFVLVGVVEDERDGEHWRVSKAACIRRWGSDAGLGKLALQGPQSSTVLDPEPVNLIPKHAVIRRISCEPSAAIWAERLG